MNQQGQFNPEEPARITNLPWKQQEATGASQEVLWQISLNGVTISGAQQHNVMQTNACVSLTMNSKAEQNKPVLKLPCLWGDSYIPASHVFSHVCYSKTPFHLCLLQ